MRSWLSSFGSTSMLFSLGGMAVPAGQTRHLGYSDCFCAGAGPSRKRFGRFLSPDQVATSLGCRPNRGDLFDKRLEILREVIPDMRHLAIIANRDNPAVALEISDAHDKARKLGIDVTITDIARVEDIAPAIDALKGHAEFLYVVIRPLRPMLIGFGLTPSRLRHKFPTMHAERGYIETGGLISYGDITPTCSAARLITSTRSSRAPSPATCRSSSRPNSSS